MSRCVCLSCPYGRCEGGLGFPCEGVGGFCAACSDAKSSVLCGLWFVYVCIAVSGCQTVRAYVDIGLMYCLYIVVMSSLECP